MLLRARPKTIKAPAVKATQHGSELAAECAQHVSKAPPPTRRVGTDMAGLREKWLEYAAIRFDALKHARRALLFSALARSSAAGYTSASSVRGTFRLPSCSASKLSWACSSPVKLQTPCLPVHLWILSAFMSQRSAKERQTSVSRVRG